jgi:hypothetical protein
MKRTFVTTAMLALALPMLADEPKKSEEPKPQPAQTTNAATTTAASDSPLVAAAKRANRLGKKSTSKVITNESLKTSGQNAHVTTTETLRTLPKGEAEPSQEVMDLQKREKDRKAAAEAAAKKEKEAKQHETKVRYAAERAEEEYPDDVDPAQSEKQLQDANKPKEEKPPV